MNREEKENIINELADELADLACHCEQGSFDVCVNLVNEIITKPISDLILKVRKETIEHEKERIQNIIKDMPDTFPELESDDYDEAYRDAKQYMLSKLS
jgi:hypothetical protein